MSNNSYKIFDLGDKPYKKGELQKNLKKLEKTYGKKFQIKYKNYLIDVVLERIKLPNNTQFYRISHDIKHRTFLDAPFIIDFIDIDAKKNNSSYITSIHKTDSISGSNMVKICLKINENLGAKKISLGDGARITCTQTDSEMDLSLIKLLERYETFYMKFGFDFDMIHNDVPHLYKFTNKNDLKKEIIRIIDKIRTIKISDIITECENTIELMKHIKKDKNKGKLEIIYSNDHPSIENKTYKQMPEWFIGYNLEYYKKILNLLKKYHKTLKISKLYKLFIELFNNNCTDYTDLFAYFFENLTYKIIYNNKKIIRKYVNDFRFLYAYKTFYRNFVYNF